MRKFLMYFVLGLAFGTMDIKPAPANAISVGFSSTPNFVQIASAASNPNATNIKLPITVTQGNALIVMVTWDSNVTATLVDKLGNSFTKNQTDFAPSPVGQGLATFSSIGIKGGIDTLTATFPSARDSRRIVAIEYTGIVGVDASVKAQALVNPVSIPLITSKTGDVLVCAMEPAGDSVTIPTFNKRKIAPSEFQVFDTVSTVVGSYPCAGTIKTNQPWMGQEIALTTLVSTGNDTQNVKIRWKSSRVSLPDSIEGYWVSLYRNGTLFYYQTSCGSGCTTGVPSRYWIQSFPTDTIDSVTIKSVPPPDSGKTADYHVSVQAVSNISRGGQCCVTSPTVWFLYRRTNITLPQKSLDSIPLTVKMVVPASFGIFGDSFRLYSKIYSDTNSINGAAMKYIGSIFPRNTTFVTTQVKTNRYSYYMTPFLFGSIVDTIYLGTVEIPNP